ncbi:MAG: F-box protein, partial [Anaerolineae bacterium]
MASSINNFSIPNEIWQHIFSFVSKCSRSSLKSVCWLWKDNIEEYERICKRYLLLLSDMKTTAEKDANRKGILDS